MSKDEYEREKINEFLQLVHSEDKRITSTGAEVVNVTGPLYNVVGSTSDPKKIPKHVGENWRPLLIAYGIPASSACYVTNATPTGNSHPSFSVGGHMTPSSDGSVPVGGKCYLMPECQWHNDPSRAGTQFYHSQTAMLQLSGYMQGELAATFLLRMPCSDAFGLLYHDDGWQHRNFTKKAEVEQFLAQLKGGKAVEHHLFERHIPDPGQSLKLVKVA